MPAEQDKTRMAKAAFVAFAASSTAARLPFKAAWHPGDAAWLMKDAPGAPPVKLLRENGEPGAAVCFVGPGAAWIESITNEGFAGAVTWAEERNRAAPLQIRVQETDHARIAVLEARGFKPDALESLLFSRDLTYPVEAATLPDDMRVCDSVDVDPEARAACHRDAWNHLAHLGIPNAVSAFSSTVYERLRAEPCYDPTLDLLIETADGRLVANCIAWIDPLSEVGEFEPFGTHVEFRGRGLARVLALEGMRRMAERGMRLARVSTAHFNDAAAKAYLGAGFELRDRMRWWCK